VAPRAPAAQHVVGEPDERLGLADRRLEVGSANIEEPVVGTLLEVQPPPQRIAAGLPPGSTCVGLPVVQPR
jgi:hypothetical protein